MELIQVANGIFYLDIPEADLYILCGCPADTVKHLKKRGLIVPRNSNGVFYESGPNAILLSDISIQKGSFANLSEFPILHMLFKQGMLIPGHPNNNGQKPILIGLANQIRAQSDYLFRGQYGLGYEEELLGSGVSETLAREMFRIKNAFAFGTIHKPGEQVRSCVVESHPVEIKNGVMVERRGVNLYRFTYKGKSIDVNLNLGNNEEYEPAVHLDFHSIRKEYFSVIHIGEGDGWDISKPCMGSIVIFQGHIYLIDAGPYILNSLKALGISVNEIEGIFHTHAHDDHFAGLTSLMYTDHRIKYYASRPVRMSVMKKLSSLMGVTERKCERAFDVVDLKLNRWNNIHGLSVMPFYSPHPVETNVFLFRAPWEHGVKQYLHLADIGSLSVLEKLLNTDPGTTDASRKILQQMKDLISLPVDVKKVDIGAGMIHGQVEDFEVDRHSKIILSHTSEKLTFRQQEIGSSASFGMVELLIPSTQDYLMQSAAHILKDYFPTLPPYELSLLLNHRIREVNAGDIILKKGSRDNAVSIILSGVVEGINSEREMMSDLSPGGIIGERAIISNSEVDITFRAASFVRLLDIPHEVYKGFLIRNFDLVELARVQDIIAFFQETRLFGELITSTLQVMIARKVSEICVQAGTRIDCEASECIYLVREGSVKLIIDQCVVDNTRVGDFFGEDNLFYHSSLLTAVASDDSRLFMIPLEAIKDIPIIEWKMLESFERRLTTFGTISQKGPECEDDVRPDYENEGGVPTSY